MKTALRILVSVLLLATPCQVIFAQNTNPEPAGSASLEIKLNPGFTIPIGESGKVFSTGSGNMLSMGYVLGYSPAYFSGIELGYNYTPLVEETNISVLTGGARFGASVRLLPTIEAGAYLGGGYFFGFLNKPYEWMGVTYNPNGGNPYFCAGVDIGWYLSRELNLGIEAVYRNYLGFSHDVSLGIGIGYHVNFKSIEALETRSIRTDELIPALMQEQYSRAPFGKLVIANKSELPAEKLRVSFFANGSMSAPVRLVEETRLDPTKSMEIPLLAKFTVKNSDFINETDITCEITAEYTYGGQSAFQRFETRIHVRRSTDFTWVNPEYIVAFIAKDSNSLLSLSKLAAEIVTEKGNSEIPKNLQVAIALQNMLYTQKVVFRQDARSPFKDFSASQDKVDSIQYPHTTLVSRQGDSDELALLYSSLFEAAGIETALIMVPGQMLIAFSPGIKGPDISLEFFHADKIISWDGKYWLPFDPAELTGSFTNAVTIGSDKWVKAKTGAQLLPVRSLLEKTGSLAPPEKGEPVKLPDKTELAGLFAKSIDSFINWEMESKAAEVRKEIQKSGSSSVLMNRLGVLYGRYGLYDKALDIFSQVILKDEYVPSLVNIGNIYYKENELNKALPFYDRAYKQAPLDVYTLLGLAKINHKLENYGNAREAYNKLKSIDPELAAQYSYLELKGDEARLTAKLTEEKEEVVWIVE